MSKSISREPTELVKQICDAIENGTRCLFCGNDKRLGVDYCDPCLADEAAEIEEIRKLLLLNKAELEDLDYGEDQS